MGSFPLWASVAVLLTVLVAATWNAPLVLSPLNSVPGAREPHSSPAQSIGGPGGIHGGGPWRISGRATPHHAGRRPAQAAQQWQLLWGRAAIQAGATDGPSQHGEEGRQVGRMNGDRKRIGVDWRESIVNGSVPQSSTVISKLLHLLAQSIRL